MRFDHQSPDFWQPFNKAWELLDGMSKIPASRKFPERTLAGLGFQMSADDDLVAIDIDHCINRETGELDERAKALIDAIGGDAYFELSPGLDGLRAFVLGDLAENINRSDLQIYTSKQFVTITGNVWQAGGIPAFDFKSPAFVEALERYPKGEKAQADKRPVDRTRRRMKPEIGESILQCLQALDMMRGDTPTPSGYYPVHCPREDEHTGGDPSGAGFNPDTPNFKCQHSHGDELRTEQLAAWLCEPEQRERLTKADLDPLELGLDHPFAGATDDDPGFDDLPPESGKGEQPPDGKAPETREKAPKKPTTKPLPLTRIDTLLSTPEPLRWLVRGYLMPNSLSLLFGDPAVGKSFFALDLACSIATGRQWHGCRVDQGPVVILAGEGHFGLRRRALAWAIENGAEDELRDSPLYISDKGAELIDLDSLMEVELAIDEVRKATNFNPRMIVVDTLHRNFGAGDENSSADVGAFVGALDRLRNRYRCNVLTVHHSGHGDKTRSRGSSALRASVDAEYSITELQDGSRQVTCHKAKDSPKPEPLAFELQSVTLPWIDDEGENETSACVRLIAASATPSAAPPASENAALAFRALIDQAIALPDGETGVPLEAWRGEFYRLRSSTPEANKKAFKRARTELADCKAIGGGSDRPAPLYSPALPSNLLAIFDPAFDDDPFREWLEGDIESERA